MAIDTYHTLRQVHVAAVLATATLFSLRWAAMFNGGRWPMAPAVRYLSYGIDTTLLTAGVSLAVLSHQYPFESRWLSAKLLLLVVYIVLGSFALKRARGRPARALCFAAAIAVLLFMVTIALTHDPLGYLGGWAGTR